MVEMKQIFQNKIYRWAIYALLFILFVILMDRVIMPWYVRLGHEVELPDVVEMTIIDAQKKLEKDGFSVLIADSIYDAHYEVGTVVEQMPLPLTTVKTGRHVYLKVSIGEKPIMMPNLFYKSPRDAQLILESFDLPLGIIEYEYSDISLEGVVISQSYPAGQVIKKGMAVNMTVSLGPFPKQPTVPQLVHKSLTVAKKQLKDLGLAKISVEFEERDDILPETIIQQSLEKGILIDETTEIVLIVSKLKKNDGL